MKYTFGIITSPNTSNFLSSVIDSILQQRETSNSPFEIIIVGGDTFYSENGITMIPFNESIKTKWITKKKNLITENAKGETIVYLHDYIALSSYWLNNFEEYANENSFNVCMTPVINYDKTRFRDWILDDESVKNILGDELGKGNPYLLPYKITNLSKLMYISGAYWVAKRDFMLSHPLNEDLVWGEGEDVEWSKRVRKNTDFKLNMNSPVRLLKYKPVEFTYSTPEVMQKIDEFIQSKQF